MKRVLTTTTEPRGHWVGDGFPVRTLFSYADDVGKQLSPFLLLDFAGPAEFPPTEARRGVGQHPHRGFETVTLVYAGGVEHHDTAGNSGRIGPGDVQWMTAARGVLHEEYHSRDFAETGGPFQMIQLWVNLPAAHKMDEPSYQELLAADIPSVDLGGGRLRVVAGAYGDATGAAHTVTPLDVWDAELDAGADAELDIPDGRTAAIVVLSGRVRVGDSDSVGVAELAVLSRNGAGIALHAEEASKLLVLHGDDLKEPVAGRGPFVMNTQGEIRQAMIDFQDGKFA